MNDLLRSASDDPAHFHNPYKAGTSITERITAGEELYVRFSTEGTKTEPIGRWLVKKSEIDGLTPEQIKDILGLEFAPTHVTEVRVPAGVKIRQGIAGEISEWSAEGGGFQTQLLENIDESYFDTDHTKRLGAIFS